MNLQQASFQFDPSPIHPYQVLDQLHDQEERISSSPREGVSPVRLPTSAVPHGPIESAYTAPSGNPYAKIGNSVALADGIIPKNSRESVSVRAFATEVRRIMRQYSPTAGVKRKLRSEFLAFIQSASKKTAARRAQILEELRKYDLEADGLAAPLFNREIGRQLRKKLQDLDTDSEDDLT